MKTSPKMSSSPSVSPSSSSNWHRTSFEERLRNGHLANKLYPCDMKVMVARGVMFRFHKHLFIAASPVFEDLLRRENPRFDDEESVRLPIDPDVFRVIYKFLYLNDLEHETIKIVDMDHALAVLEASVQYKIDQLEPQIMSRVKVLMSPQNVFKVLEVARRMAQVSPKFIELESDALDMVCQNGESLLLSEEFYQLGLYEAARILSSDALAVSSELQVFKAALRWAEVKAQHCENMKKGKRYYFRQLVDSVRFPLMTPEEMAVVVLNDDLLSTQDIIQLFKYVCLPPLLKYLAPTKFEAKPRNSSTLLVKVFKSVEVQTEEKLHNELKSQSTSEKNCMPPPVSLPSPSSPCHKKRRLTDSDCRSSVSFADTATIMGDRTEIMVEDDIFLQIVRKTGCFSTFDDLFRKCIKQNKDEIGSVILEDIIVEQPFRLVLYKRCKELTLNAKCKFIEGSGKDLTRNFLDFVSSFDPMRYLVVDTKGNLPMTIENIWALGQNILLKFNGVTFLKVNHKQGENSGDDDKSVNQCNELVLNYMRGSLKILGNDIVKLDKLAMSNCEFSIKSLKSRTKQIKNLILYRCWGEYSMDDILLNCPDLEELVCWKTTPSFWQKGSLMTTPLIMNVPNFAARQNIKKVVLFSTQLNFPSRCDWRKVALYATELYLDECTWKNEHVSVSEVFHIIFPKLERLVIVEKPFCGTFATSRVINSAIGGIETLKWLQVNGMKWKTKAETNMYDLSEAEDVKLLEFLKFEISDESEDFLLEKDQRGRSIIWTATQLNAVEKESVDIDGGGWSQRDEQEYQWFSLSNFYDSYEVFEDYFLQDADKFPRPILWN